MTVTQFKHRRHLLCVSDKLYLYLVLLALVLLSFHSATGELCKFDVDPCICSTSNFQLNLKSVMEARSGKDFQVTGDDNTFIYYVQPCNRKLSTESSSCNKVHLNLVSCQIHQPDNQSYGLGSLNNYDATQGQESFILTNSFTDPIEKITRKLHLTIRCSDQESQFTYQGNSGSLSPITYYFTLATRHFCTGGGSKGLSPGSIMVIIFFVLLIVYLVGGVLFQKFVRKAQGPEIVPNLTFWKDVPFVVKDGFVFTFQCCKGSSGYDQI